MMFLSEEERKEHNRDSCRKYRQTHLEQIRARDKEIARIKRKSPEYRQYYKEYRSRSENKKRDVEAHRERRRNPEIRKQINLRQREYYQTHKKQRKEYYNNHREEQIEKALKWNREHMPQFREREKTRYHKNPLSRNMILKRNSKWAKKHRSQIREKHKEWIINNPERFAEIQARERHRRRGLGYIPLNISFIGAVRHHIDKSHVVFIPKELHNQYHCLKTGRGMKKMNNKAFEWLNNQQLPDESIQMSLIYLQTERTVS
jgi:hypothetical protein